MKHLPAFKAAIFAAIGIAIGRNFPGYMLTFLAAAIGFLLLAVAVIATKRRLTTPDTILSSLCLLFSFAFVMSLKVSSISSTDLSAYRCFAGTVVESPRDPSSSSVLLDDCYGFKNRWEKIHGKISLVSSGRSTFETGDRLIVAGKALPISSARNPGDFDFKSYYLLAGIVGRVYLKSGKDIVYIGHPAGFSFRRSVVELVRNFMRSEIRSSMTGEQAELARAMVIGERNGISREINEQFINTGTIHILCVSGLHIGFLTAILVTLAALFRIPRRFRFFLIAPLLVFYAFIVGMTPSIMRSVVMALVILFGVFLQRRSQVINSIGFAALLIIAIDPAQLYSPGFQLSFAAVLSIAFFYKKMTEMIRHSYPNLEERQLLNSVISLSALTIAATLGTVPLTVFYFGRLSVVSIIANLLIVPLAGLFATMTFTFLFMGVFSSFLSSVYGAASQVIAFLILSINSMLGSSSFSNVRLSDSRLLFGLLYFLWLAAVISFGRNNLVKKLLVAVLLGGDLIIVSSLLQAHNEAKVFVLDVGQGDAIYIELPGGKNILVDSGMRFGRADVGERIVAPFLEGRGVQKIDHFVITHLHSDHIGGAAYLLRKFDVRDFIYPDQGSLSATWRNTLTTAKSMRIPNRTARSGMILDSGANYRVYILHPNRKYVGEGGSSYRTRFNDGSVIMKVCIGKEAFLLVGDIGRQVEHELVSCYGSFLKSTVFKVGHHGSSTSSSQEFIETVRPRFAVISVGARNRFDHPSREVVDRLSEDSVITWRTDSLGGAYFRATTNACDMVSWR